MINIILEDSPALKQKAPEYDFDNHPKFLENDTSFGLSDFVDSMYVAMKINHGVGLASPQIGHSLRIFVMDVLGEEFTCINPEILEHSEEKIIGQEGCLSFPLLSLNVKRSEEIYVSYQNINGMALTRWLVDTQARCFQHELDHLNGITFDTQVGTLSLKMAKQKRQKKIKQARRKNNG